MAELPEQIKVGKTTKERLLNKQEKEGHSSMDSVVRDILNENDKLKIENELLKIKLFKYKEK